jgi:putative MATE family efflux protein
MAMSPNAAARASVGELATEHPGRLLLRYSWPALVGMTLNALYAVVDRVFIGQGCGVDAMAGLQMAMPVVMFLTAFGPLIGIGHAAVLSIRLGAGDRVACEKLLGQTIALKILLYATLIPLLYVFLDEILSFCGAARVTPGAREAAATYLRIVLFSHFFSHLAFGLSSLHRAEGGAVRSMLCMIVGFGTNLVLDPLFIFGFGMGIAGAAWATLVAMFASALWALGYYARGKTAVRLRLRRVRLYPSLLARPLAIGLAPFLTHLMGSLVIGSLQYAFSKWMPDEASRTDQIASLGVYNGALLLMFMPMLGAQQGLQPIIGYNWGARNYRRVLAALRMGLLATGALTLAAFVLQTVPPFPTLLARLFVPSDNAALVALCAKDLALANAMIWCIALNVVATTYFQSIGHPRTAIVLSFLRQGACLLPMVWILPHWLDDKALAIWLAMPVSDVICCLATIPPLWINLRFLSRVRDRTAAAAR